MTSSKRGYKFDPFNLSSQSDSEHRKITFERLQSSVKTRSIWWLLAACILVYLAYLYISAVEF